MERHSVEISNDHLIRQSQCAPETAIEELIWNALDAGGDRVTVRFIRNDLNLLESIEVEDHGSGIHFDDLPRAFGTIGKSLKNERPKTREGRVCHGREGRGRFKAIALGKEVVWRTTYRDDSRLYTYRIRISNNKPKQYENDEAPEVASERNTGTFVRIAGIDEPIEQLTSEKIHERLTERLALYLRSYPRVQVRYDGKLLDIKPLIKNSKDYELEITDDSSISAILSVIEWSVEIGSKKLLLADEDGFTWHEIQAGVRARDIFYTAYLRFKRARQWAEEGRFQLGEVDSEISCLIERARESLREHIRSRMAEQARDLVKQWKTEQIYPYVEEEPKNVVEKAERQVFDIVASRVHRYHSPFRSGDARSRQFTLQLVRQALESNPSSLKRILEEVLKLPKQQQDELSELLQSTSLPGLIRAASTVRDRLMTIAGFKEILYGEDWRVRLRERTQLHRLLVHHLWLVGEEYTLDTDDEPLRAVLEKHLECLGRELLAEEKAPKLIDGKDGIPDLMLSRSFERDRGQLEHLVVELKRPSVRLGAGEITQIKKYAYAVSAEPRFSKTKVCWRFMLLGNEWDKFAEQEASDTSRPYGCIGQQNNLSIWLMPWSDVLHEAKSRYKFFSKRLEVEASADEGIRHLEKNYPALLSGKGLTKKQEHDLANDSGG